MTRTRYLARHSRALLRTATATAAVSALVCAATPTALAVDTVRVVNPSGLGGNGPWFRLQDQGQDPDPERPPGIQEIAPKSDPVHLNGSLHLAVKNNQQSQAAYPFSPLGTLKPLQRLLDQGVSYWAYTDTESEENSLADFGPNLQFPSDCGGFTTLSFEPGRNKDTQGNRLQPDTWQLYKLTGDSVMRTSRAVAGLPANADAPLSYFVKACAGAGGVIANVGRLGAGGGSLDTYVDNITFDGTTWNFAVTGRATAALTTPEEIVAGDDARPADASYSNPGDGPEYAGIGTHLTLDGPHGLGAEQLTVVSEGKEVELTEQPNGTLTGDLPTNLRAGGNLEPGGEAGADFTLTAASDAPSGTLKVTTELTVGGANGQPVLTGVRASDRTRIVAEPGDGPGQPHPTPSHTRPPHDSWPPHHNRPPHEGRPSHEGRPPHQGWPAHYTRPPHEGRPSHDTWPPHHTASPSPTTTATTAPSPTHSKHDDHSWNGGGKHDNGSNHDSWNGEGKHDNGNSHDSWNGEGKHDNGNSHDSWNGEGKHDNGSNHDSWNGEGKHDNGSNHDSWNGEGKHDNGNSHDSWNGGSSHHSSKGGEGHGSWKGGEGHGSWKGSGSHGAQPVGPVDAGEGGLSAGKAEAAPTGMLGTGLTATNLAAAAAGLLAAATAAIIGRFRILRRRRG
ncbi:hypothetical protein ABZS81_25330 [Streptomyces sp. NPDC005318]|uniref:hypothetical protein n=1 Tax=Streptomyces sp. NPDC005318 TaxID=3157031 RepID=UPI0033A43FE2